MKRGIQSLEHLLELGGIKRDILFLILSGLALAVSIFDLIPLPFDAAWVAIVLCGVPILLEAVIGLVTAFDIKADVLVSLALIASVYIGEDFAAGEVAFIMQLGALLEDLTVARARAGIEKLVHLTPQTARVLTAQGETVIPAQQVRIGDRLRVLPGETVPVDGVIRSGETSINQAVMTGESMPVDKCPGDPVSSGTVNQFGAFEMEAVKVGEDSSIQRMIRLVQSADAGKAKIVGLADRWATWIVVIALTAAVLTWLATGESIRAVTILVVFCPCALVLATPTAIMAAIGNATKHGFLVREGDALERLATVSKVTFDKTGTLTQGTPQVIAVLSFSEHTEEELYTLAAGAEQLSEHPLGKAILRCRKESCSEPLPPAEQFQMIPGQGVSARVEGRTVLAGNETLLAAHELFPSPDQAVAVQPHLEQGRTVTWLAVDGKLAGCVVLADTLRPDSAAMVDQLLALGVQPVLLTGDHENVARSIAAQLHIHRHGGHCHSVLTPSGHGHIGVNGLLPFSSALLQNRQRILKTRLLHTQHNGDVLLFPEPAGRTEHGDKKTVLVQLAHRGVIVVLLHHSQDQLVVYVGSFHHSALTCFWTACSARGTAVLIYFIIQHFREKWKS